jgi:signal transduction histidine kinase
MPEKESLIWIVVIFGTALLTALGAVIISFVFLHQRKKYRHRQEVNQLQENFAQEMLHSKAEIQEQTLQYVAAEIHDNFNPNLSVINLNLASVLPIAAEPVKTTIADTKDLVKQLMLEMRTLSKSLNSNQINRVGFAPMLEEFLERIRKSEAYRVVFEKKGDMARLPSDKEIILFRMCQEALNNIVKHADAKHIFVTIHGSAETYTIEIRDDGKGFEPPPTGQENEKKGDGSGLRNLFNRAKLIAAELKILSQPGSGTAIMIAIKR